MNLRDYGRAMKDEFRTRMTRKASIKETGEEISQAEWERFDAAVAEEKAKRPEGEPHDRDSSVAEPITPGAPR